MKVLVTGGTGFVGSHAVRTLLADGHDVSVLARTPQKVAPLMEKMGVDPDGVEVVAGDITDEGSVDAAVAGCDAVVHTAAVVATDPTAEEAMEATNLAGATNVLGAAVAAGCDPIVHVSSVSALFPFQTDPVTADHPVMGSANAYGRTKAACDRLARSYQDAGEPVVIIYPSGIAGPDDWNESVNLSSFVLWLRTGLPRSKGFASSYIDVRDVAAVISAVMEPGQGPHRYLTMGTFLSSEELVAAVGEAIGGKVKSLPIPRAAFWAWGRLGDFTRRFGRDIVFTSDAYDYVFQSKPGDDSPTVAATGVEFRPIVETFADTFRWMYEAGHIEAKYVGELAHR